MIRSSIVKIFFGERLQIFFDSKPKFDNTHVLTRSEKIYRIKCFLVGLVNWKKSQLMLLNQSEKIDTDYLANEITETQEKCTKTIEQIDKQLIKLYKKCAETKKIVMWEQFEICIKTLLKVRDQLDWNAESFPLPVSKNIPMSNEVKSMKRFDL